MQSLIAKCRTVVAVVALASWGATAALASDSNLWSKWFGAECDCPTKQCCDDYCRKPLPCAPCTTCPRGCDDYCRKPMPCTPCCVRGTLCDDYCSKPMPCIRCRSTVYDVCVPYRVSYCLSYCQHFHGKVMDSPLMPSR
ncbi:hypothetical protein [Aeoliella mucimassa]|uniref:Uncharacterized protein n=1 Tax=Aeoliella mucimassa TaxID=2527972 RepID=A0A518AQN0_9BACT|nr:hypothetical protein [Aeoliella mucimassa]QDU57026.1 hypothetical protein Pan181_32400 [Aeoliella mucimassa]